MYFCAGSRSMVASAVIFRSLFATDGFVNSVLIQLGILETGYNFLGRPVSAKIILMMIRVWKNLGYQMIFYLAALQSIDIVCTKRQRWTELRHYKDFSR